MDVALKIKHLDTGHTIAYVGLSVGKHFQNLEAFLGYNPNEVIDAARNAAQKYRK